MAAVVINAVATWVTSQLALEGTAALLFKAAVVIAGTSAISRAQARRAEDEQRQAFNASLQDRLVTINSGTAPSKFLYGTFRTGGVLLFKPFSSGDKGQYAHIGVVFSHRPITSFDQIMFGSKVVGLPGADGFLHHPDYVKKTDRLTGLRMIGGAPGSTYRLAETPKNEAVYFAPLEGGDTVPQKGVDFHLVDGRTIVWDQDWSNRPFQMSYTVTDEKPLVRVKLYTGAPGQQADPDLIAESNGRWTAEHRGVDQVWAYFRFEFDQDIFPQGLPEISVIGKGHPVLDERTGVRGFSSNPVWIIQDYLTDPDGGGIPTSRINTAAHVAEGNICDEVLSVAGKRRSELEPIFSLTRAWDIGSVQQNRYTCNGVISSGEIVWKNLEDLATSCAGGVACVQGRWRVYTGNYDPPTLAIDETFLTGERLSIVPAPSGDQLFNTVKGLFADASNLMTQQSSPAVSNPLYVQQDGGVEEREIVLPMTNDWLEAQRLQRYYLEEARQSTQIILSCNRRAYDTAWRRTVLLNIPWLGYVNKPFLVVDRDFQAGGGVDLVLKETSPDIWEVGIDELVDEDLAPNTTLQNVRSVPLIEGLRVLKEDASMLPGATLIVRPVLVWEPVSAAAVTRGGRIEIQQRVDTSRVWQPLAPLFGDQTQTLGEPLSDSRVHFFRARAISALGVAGEWSETSYQAADWSLEYYLPPIRDLSGRVIGQDLVLEWGTRGEETGVDEFEVRQGEDYLTAVRIAGVGAHTYSLKVSWQGNRRFHVVALGFDGKAGKHATVDVQIEAPVRPVVQAEVIDNNVLLRWSDSTRSLPVVSYAVERVTSAGVVQLQVGDNGDGRFAAIFEQQAGDFVYQVRAIDSAGNQSPGGQAAAKVSQPPDYVLQDNRDLTWSGTRQSILIEAGRVLAPMNTTETWAQHFTTRGWASMADAIAAGSDGYAEPYPSSATYTEEIDYGVLIAASTVAVSLAKLDLQGTVSAAFDIAWRATTGDAWTEVVGAVQAPASNFRYLRIRLRLTAGSADALCELVALNVKLSLKLKRESISASAVAGDSGGTSVSFTAGFLDVRSIQVTPQSTAAVIAVYDFVDVPNPTGCKVLVFDRSTGARVSVPVSIDVTGV